MNYFVLNKYTHTNHTQSSPPLPPVSSPGLPRRPQHGRRRDVRHPPRQLRRHVLLQRGPQLHHRCGPAFVCLRLLLFPSGSGEAEGARSNIESSHASSRTSLPVFSSLAVATGNQTDSRGSLISVDSNPSNSDRNSEKMDGCEKVKCKIEINRQI